MENKLGLSAPWHIFHSQVKALFAQDCEVSVDEEIGEIDGGFGYTFGIYSDNKDKLQAIKKLIGSKVVFGDVPVIIDYGENEEDVVGVWERAFGGNPLFCRTVKNDMPYFGNFNYALFKRDIISFYGDDLSDVKGNVHYIVSDLVKEVVANQKGMFVCTES